VSTPWTHTAASNYPSVYCRIVSGGYTSSYDVGKFDVDVPATRRDDKFPRSGIRGTASKRLADGADSDLEILAAFEAVALSVLDP